MTTDDMRQELARLRVKLKYRLHELVLRLPELLELTGQFIVGARQRLVAIADPLLELAREGAELLEALRVLERGARQPGEELGDALLFGAEEGAELTVRDEEAAERRAAL